MKTINYESDFKLIEGFSNGSSMTNAPFRFTYYVSPSKGTHVVEYDGSEYVNCFPKGDGRVVVPFDGVRLGQGVLMAKREYFLNDSDFMDGICHLVSEVSTGIVLSKGASDDVGDITVSVATPYHTLNSGTGGGEIPNGSITEYKLANGAVSTNKIKDGAITEAKLSEELSEKINSKTGALDSDMLIGNTSLGDSLLSISNSHELVTNNYLDKTPPAKLKAGTPFQSILDALLYKEKDIARPSIDNKQGTITHVVGNVSFKFTAEKDRPRPNDWITVEITYTPNAPTSTDSYVKGMEWGYATDSEGENKSDDKSVVKEAVIGEQVGQQIVSVTHGGGSTVEHVEGNTYRFQAVRGNNVITATVNEGTRQCYIDGIVVWPLDSSKNVYEMVEVERLDATLENTLNKEGSYTIANPLQPDVKKDDAYAQLNGGNVAIDEFDIPSVGEKATFTITPTYATCDTTNPKIYGMRFGYATDSALADKVLDRQEIEGTFTVTEITEGSVVVKHNGDTLTPTSENTYEFIVANSSNKITAELTQPEYACKADAVTVYPLDEDGGHAFSLENGVTAMGFDKTLSVANPLTFTLKEFEKVLPVKLRYNNGDEYVEKELEYNGNESAKTKEDGVTLSNAGDVPFYIIMPSSYPKDTIKTFIWTTLGTPRYTTIVVEYTEDTAIEVPNGYNAFKCEDPEASDGTYYITIKNA